MPEEPKRIGYTFKGWNTKADGKGKSFDETSEITEDIKVYAIWEADKYTIKYEKEEGAEEIEQVTDKPIKLPEEEPKKPGHSFVGWTPDPEAVEAYPELDLPSLVHSPTSMFRRCLILSRTIQSCLKMKSSSIQSLRRIQIQR